MKQYTVNSYQQIHALLTGASLLACPEKLYLDITEDCNLFCRMCRDEKSVSGRTMNRSLFERIVLECAPYVKSWSLFNWGEPLLAQDFRGRVEFVNRNKTPDAEVDISTNGMALLPDTIAFLRAQKVIVCVSFDGADRKTFEYIRRGADFGRVCENLRSLTAAYADTDIRTGPSVYVSLQRDNRGQLLPIARLARDLGVRRFGCGLVTAPKQYAVPTDDALRAELEQTYAFLDDNGMLCDLYPTRVGNHVRWGDRYEPIEGFMVDDKCRAAAVSAAVAYDGKVYLCCNGGACAGSLANGASFLELWKSAVYEELREKVNGEGMPDRCRHCPWVNR